jgi:hypothetical protein
MNENLNEQYYHQNKEGNSKLQNKLKNDEANALRHGSVRKSR